ncbi:MAG: tetratricopeptide repeat protein [Acidobacteriaceae bacterium]|nr:tetratricopeptide repeat protein [Acidobacteriaceae bacterium]
MPALGHLRRCVIKTLTAAYPLFAGALAISCANVTPDELVNQGHFRRAEPIIAARLQSNPNDADALYLLSKVKLAANDPEAALSFVEKGENRSPKRALSRARGQCARDHHGSGRRTSPIHHGSAMQEGDGAYALARPPQHRRPAASADDVPACPRNMGRRYEQGSATRRKDGANRSRCRVLGSR